MGIQGVTTIKWSKLKDRLLAIFPLFFSNFSIEIFVEIVILIVQIVIFSEKMDSMPSITHRAPQVYYSNNLKPQFQQFHPYFGWKICWRMGVNCWSFSLHPIKICANSYIQGEGVNPLLKKRHYSRCKVNEKTNKLNERETLGNLIQETLGNLILRVRNIVFIFTCNLSRVMVNMKSQEGVQKATWKMKPRVTSHCIYMYICRFEFVLSCYFAWLCCALMCIWIFLANFPIFPVGNLTVVPEPLWALCPAWKCAKLAYCPRSVSNYAFFRSYSPSCLWSLELWKCVLMSATKFALYHNSLIFYCSGFLPLSL